MDALDHELRDAYQRAAMAEFKSSQSRLEEIARVLPRLRYEAAEVRAAREVIDLWRRQGRNTALGPLDPAYALAGDGARLEMQRGFVTEGLLFACSGDLGVELLIVKTNAGRGIFGREKVRYACYYSNGDGHYSPVGTTSTLLLALTKLGALYRT